VEVTLATTIRQTEAAPEAYPAKPSGLSAAAAAIDQAVIWSRLEGYCGYRWSQRVVVWIAEGAGAWFPPLAPAAIETIERWEAGAWVEDATLCASPMGGYILHAATYRFTGSAGPETPAAPALVNEAYRRIAEYFASAMSAAHPGVRQSSIEGIGSHTFDPTAVARAMERSGAGDLLRTYRRAA
jgi:hypothetical protein